MIDEEIDREVVVPGDFLSLDPDESGEGTYIEDGRVYAARHGVVDRRERIKIISLAGKYVPSVADSVIGKVIDIEFPNWFVDINSPYKAILHVSEYSDRIHFGEMSDHIRIGDLIYAKVKEVSPGMRVFLTLFGNEFCILSGGRVIEILYAKVPRLIGRGGSMINMLKEGSNCDIYIGQNGRIWLNGSERNVDIIIRIIQRIEREAHTSGLTKRISKSLEDERKNETY
jgi:exosome complex component RRP4